MHVSHEDLLDQKFMEILKKDKESRQDLKSLLRENVFDSAGISISFNEVHDVVVHFGPRFFNQETFMKGSRFNRSLNNSAIKKFFDIMENLSISTDLGFVVCEQEKPSATNLNMEIIFSFPWSILKSESEESSEMTVREATKHLKNRWAEVKSSLGDYYSYKKLPI